MARIGSFQGPTTPYGVPPGAIHPSDNDISPDPAQAESDRLKSEADELYQSIKNLGNDYTNKPQGQ